MAPTARARLAAFVLGAIGAMAAQSPPFFLASWLGAVVPLCIVTGIWRAHARFCVVIVLPIAAMLAGIWIYLLGAPPGVQRGTDPVGAAEFCATTSLRLVLLGGFAQLLFLTIPRHRLVDTFRQWGLRDDLLVAALGTYVLFPELRIRADQIITARMARGHVANRRLWTRAQQLVPSLGVLFTLAVRTAVQRASHWLEQDLFAQFAETEEAGAATSRVGSATFVLAAVMWAAAGICLRLC